MNNSTPRYRRGDPSPVDAGLVFLRYSRGKEIWVSPERLEKTKALSRVVNARQRKKPGHQKMMREYFREYNKSPKQKSYREKYYFENKTKIDAANMARYLSNPDRLVRLELRAKEKAEFAAFKASGGHRARRSRQALERYRKNKKKVHAQIAVRRRNNPGMRLKQNISRRIRQAMAATDCRKDAGTIEILGCTIPDFRSWLERQFEPGMTWENYGTSGWNIDHIIPIARFPLDEPVAVRHAFNYRNCRPMWRIPNIAKNDTLDMALVAKHELWEWLPYVTEPLSAAA